MLELAQKRGFEAQSTSLESFREKFVLHKPMKDLNAVLASFVLFQKILDRPETLERVSFEVVEDCWNEGTHWVELRYSPCFVSEFSHLDWSECLQSFERGIARALLKYPQMKVGLICIATRDYGVESVDQIVDFFIKNQKHFIGIDLAGNEAQFPCHLFENSFKKVKKASGRVTIHAGEDSGPENVWEAIELMGAHRIGHGIASIKDPQLIQTLISRKICLEMCPTSNWLTHAVTDLKNHPLPQVLRAGVQVCINTDDPTIFGVSLKSEIELCRSKMLMTHEELMLCQTHARTASFLK